MPPQPHREALRSAVRGACLAAKQNWIPALAYLQTAFGSGCRDSICLRGLMTAYLATGDVTAAERTLAEWRQSQPASGEIAHFERELQKMRLDASLPSVAPSPDNEESISLTDRRLRLDVQPEASAPVSPKTAGRPSVWADVEAHR